MNLGIWLKETQTLRNIRDRKLQTRNLKVINIEIPFIKCQVFLLIRVLVLKRGLVLNMVRFLISLQNFFNSTLFRIHRKKTSVRYVGKCLVSYPI